MPATKTLILDHEKVEQKINRIAHQIHENCFRENEIVIVGITQRGYLLAERLCKVLRSIKGPGIRIYELTINKKSPLQEVVKFEQGKKDLEHKTVILVDDVLSSGKTLIYAAGHILSFYPKRLITVVLVDRKHRQFPIRADFVGMTLATTLQEHIHVDLGNGQDAVYLQ